MAVLLFCLCVVGIGVWGVSTARTRAESQDYTLFLDGREGVVGPTSGSAVAADASVATSTATTTQIIVQVVGAVISPGVYRLPRGARVFEAVAAAGGARADADLEAINLAAPVGDGARIVVPRIGQEEPPAAGDRTPGEEKGQPVPVSLSTADAATLDTLPGIGPATAAAIIAYREEHGPFQSVEDLVKVPGIGPATLAKIRSLVVP